VAHGWGCDSQRCDSVHARLPVTRFIGMALLPWMSISFISAVLAIGGLSAPH
jgi:hypothetical protein